MNSRTKGANGEREFARKLQEYGYDARRGQQYKGGSDSPDVVGLDGVHIEVKRVEHLRLYDAMAQSIRDAGEELPIVAHRKNGERWLVTVTFPDFMKLYEGWKNGFDKQK